MAGESPNDRNDRAIREATKWYDQHLAASTTKKQNRVRAVLLTDDADNRKKALAAGLLACSVGDYVKSLTDHPELQDKLAHKSFDLANNKLALFPPHLTPNEIHAGIKTGKLLQGSFMASNENYLEGSVNVEGYEKFVNSFKERNSYGFSIGCFFFADLVAGS